VKTLREIGGFFLCPFSKRDPGGTCRAIPSGMGSNFWCLIANKKLSDFFK